MLRRIWLFMLLALPLTVPFWAQNEADIFRDVSPSVVSIEVEVSRFDTAGGAGFVIDSNGHIVTNAHVVEGARALTVVFHDGYEAPAKLLGMDTRVDLAVIKVDAADHRLKPVTFGDSDALVVGQRVLAIGNPYGLEATLTTGIISGLNRSLENNDGTTMEGAIQTDAMLAPGNSGGPLLNQAGEVIGVNTAGYRGTALGFAIPSITVQRVTESMIIFAVRATREAATKAAASALANWDVAAATYAAAYRAEGGRTIVVDAAAATLVAAATNLAGGAHGAYATFVAADAELDAAWATLDMAAPEKAEAALATIDTAWVGMEAAWATLDMAAPEKAEAALATWVAELTEAESTKEAVWATRTEEAAAALATWDAGRETREAVAVPTRKAAVVATFEAAGLTVVAANATYEAAFAAWEVALSDWEAVLVTMEVALATVEAVLATSTAAPTREAAGATIEAVLATNEAVFATDEAAYATVNAAVTAVNEALAIAELAWVALQAIAPEKASAIRATMTAEAARATPTPTPSPTATSYFVFVDGAVNLRSGPGTNHDRVGVARPGDIFEVISYQAGSPYNWLKVRYDGGVTWIAESLTRLRG